MRVVPFGERAPFSEYAALRWLNQLAPEPPIEPATSVKPLKLNDINLGTLICFESCFSTPAKILKAQGARVLFVLTNDEWFAGTTAPWEHAAMSTLRAVENDISVAQSANGGYVFAIDARGRFIKLSPPNKAGVLAAELRLR
jgi:apolipoprotein N-acyltransferase